MPSTEDAWSDEWLAVVFQMADRIAALSKANPWPDNKLLPQAMTYLMSELWDRGFSQTEIRRAFEQALEDMPRYAAGEEVRGSQAADFRSGS